MWVICGQYTWCFFSFFSRSYVGRWKMSVALCDPADCLTVGRRAIFHSRTKHECLELYCIILVYQWIRHVMFNILDAAGYFQYLYCLWAMTSHDEAQVRRVALTLEWSSRFRHLAYCPEPVQEPPSPLILRSGGPSHKFLKDNSHQAQYVVVLQFCLACLSWKASKFARKKSHSLCRFTLLSNLGSHPLGSQY